jgi:hypothetical protein
VRDRLRRDRLAGVDRERSEHGRHSYLPAYCRARGSHAEHDLPLPAHFTTTLSKSAATGPDVAQGARIVAVSSQFSSDYRAGNAVDGDLSTEWSSHGDGNHAFITIDLGKPMAISGVAFRTRAMSDGSAITHTFAVIVDGGRRYGPFLAGNRLDARPAPVSFRGRRLRFQVVSSTGGNTGAAEIQVFSSRRPVPPR